jgi:peptidoglycan-associated lipoprotein
MKKMIIVLLLIFAIGCKDKYVRAPDEPIKPAEETMKEEVMMPEEVKEEVIEEVGIAKEEQVTEEELSLEEKAKSIFKDVLFDYDKYNIRPEARSTLDAVSTFLNDKSTKNYLVSLGVSPSRVIIMTYGEEKPVCTDRDEACWQSNRRAHFVVSK